MMNYLNIAKIVFTIGKLIFKIVKKKSGGRTLDQKELHQCAVDALDSMKCH